MSDDLPQDTASMAAAERPAPVGLFERERELAWLDRLVERLVVEGVGGAAVIEGPAGIGKSRLLRAARERAADRGATTLGARAVELEHHLGFGGVRQLLASAVGALDRTTRRHVLRGPAADATRVLSSDVGGPARREISDPFFGLATLVANLAERAPLVLAVDDAQWLDDASIRFLAYLARRAAGQPVLILATHRPDPAIENGAVADLVSQADLLRPDRLSQDGVGRLLDTILGPAMPAQLAVACLRLTGGTPFLVEEVARALADVEAAERLSAVEQIAPEPIGRAVLGRIRKLPTEAAKLAEAVALFPSGATLADAAAVAELEPRMAAIAADALVTASVLGPEAMLSFLHPVMRAAVYDQLGLHGRRHGHARAAKLLMDRSADAEAVADHLLAADPSGDAARVAVLEKAAARAERAGALPAAIRYLARAVEEPPPAERRGALQRRLGQLQLRAGADDAEASLAAALGEATARADRVDISVELASAQLAAGHADQATESLSAVRGPAAAVDRERLLVVEAMLASAAWESERHADLYAGVADVLPRDLTGATPGERFALSQVAYRIFDRCEPHDQVIDVLRRVVAGEEDPATAAVGTVNISEAMHLLVSCGALEDAERACRTWEQRARAHGPERLYVMAQLGLVRVAWFRGDLHECEALVRLGLELPEGPTEARQYFASWLGALSTVRGAFDDARRWIEASRATGAGASFGIEVSYESGIGTLALAEGRPGDAVDHLERARIGLERRGSANPAESTWLADLVDALMAVDRSDEAIALAATLLERAEAFGAARPLGRFLVAHGRCLSGRDQLARFERAVDVLAPSPHGWDEAKARLELGAALRRANRRRDARPHLRLALDYATRNGLGPMAERARAELLAAGARPRRATLTGVAALTPSEARICRLAAGELTNREIASQLFLTVKTIEMHLANAFGKLEIESRRDLGRVLGPADHAKL